MKRRADVKAIKIGKNWKKPSPAAFKITYIGLVAADRPHAAMTATIPLIIPAAAKGPRKGWKILETKDTKRSKRFPLGASPSSISRLPPAGRPPTWRTSA